MGCLGGMSFPAISSIKANNVDVHEQGQIQGALYGARALAVRNQQPPNPRHLCTYSTLVMLFYLVCCGITAVSSAEFRDICKIDESMCVCRWGRGLSSLQQSSLRSAGRTLLSLSFQVIIDPCLVIYFTALALRLWYDSQR